jgi:hypothetical protein
MAEIPEIEMYELYHKYRHYSEYDFVGFDMNEYDRQKANEATREDLVKKYAWAVPSPGSLSVIARHGPIVEIGAGNGYWAYLLRAMGVDIVAYDKRVKDQFNPWITVERGGANRVRSHPDRTLFLCWPPYWNNMAYNALRWYRGDKVIYVGEGWGGCTGNDSFFELLGKEWHEIDGISMFQFRGIRDHMAVYERGVE